MKLSTLLLTTALLLTATACDQKPDSPTPPTPTATPTASTPPTPVRKEKCLLCTDHEIEVTPSTPRTSHDGKEYFFCSDFCKEDFVKDPAAALAKHSPPTRPSTPPAPPAPTTKP